ncbi:hypothetical protein QQS21_001445 [Conoideocrella luteorostrata]|uniref:Arylsulfotransferase n=1 Tax=Conoideocrella luteorostrata TaxID=1105319 RepID=A0AAJ0FXH1_9HYPO|nr:hypothetical protein QQS21_001445 [Conoideocrella luteorostrata]
MVLDSDGHLVWMPSQSEFRHARDFQVQNLRGENYITFLSGKGAGGYGDAYTMLDSSYKVHKLVKPVGNFTGRLSGFRLTHAGTALITISQVLIYEPIDANVPKFETIFQEIDLDYGELLFEWRASRHNIAPSSDPIPIQNVDKDVEGNFLVSTERSIICLSGIEGHVLWRLGGDGNEFQALSKGATSLSPGHHATWHNSTTLLITNGHSDGSRDLSQKRYSPIMLVKLDVLKRTATVIKDFRFPHQSSTSTETIQFLNTTILTHKEETSIVMEYADKELLCEMHLAAARLPSSWTPSYRVAKHKWSGHPDTLPQVAVRPLENAVYVSWNGATDIDSWIFQSGPEQNGNVFIDHIRVRKTGFETRIELPRRTENYIRLVALDRNGKLASISAAVSKHVKIGGNFIDTKFEPRIWVALAVVAILAACLGRDAYRPIIRRAKPRHSSLVKHVDRSL